MHINMSFVHIYLYVRTYVCISMKLQLLFSHWNTRSKDFFENNETYGTYVH